MNLFLAGLLQVSIEVAGCKTMHGDTMMGEIHQFCMDTMWIYIYIVHIYIYIYVCVYILYYLYMYIYYIIYII